MKEFLEGVVGVVEANSFETMCLWHEYRKKLESTWTQGAGGPLVTVGEMEVKGKMYPVCISLLTNTVNGRKILFLEATSMLVNWDMIENWLIDNLPPTAISSTGFVNKTNAMNFHNLLT